MLKDGPMQRETELKVNHLYKNFQFSLVLWLVVFNPIACSGYELYA
jgi:hypothetical protein